jgi:hypothetical protein
MNTAILVTIIHFATLGVFKIFLIDVRIVFTYFLPGYSAATKNSLYSSGKGQQTIHTF